MARGVVYGEGSRAEGTSPGQKHETPAESAGLVRICGVGKRKSRPKGGLVGNQLSDSVGGVILVNVLSKFPWLRMYR